MASATPRRLIFLTICAILSGCSSIPHESDYLDCHLHSSGPLNEGDPQSNNPTPLFRAPSLKLQSLISKNALKDRSLTPETPTCDPSHNGDFDILALSSGGADGAFGNGFAAKLIEKNILGMNSRGVRPCIVTGVSAGAILSTYAFLATSRDPDVASHYKPLFADSLFKSFSDQSLSLAPYGALSIPFHTSIYNISGLKAELHKRFDPSGARNIIRDIANEYINDKRKLLVGTTNVFTNAFEIIDLTQIAADPDDNETDANRGQCLAEAVRASAAIPAVFEPVPIRDTDNLRPKELPEKLFVDGANRRNFFFDSQVLTELAGPRQVNIYLVVDNNFVVRQIKPAPQTLITLAGRESAIATDELARELVSLARAQTIFYNHKTRTAKVNIIVGDTDDAIQCTTAAPSGSIDDKDIFNPKYLNCMFKAGQKAAEKEHPW